MTWDARVYVRRRGRLTTGQARALAEHGARYRTVDLSDCPAPRMVEIGFGAGQALVEFAATHPDWTCVGIEVYQPGIGSLSRRCEERGIGNVRVVEEDVRSVLPTWPADSVRLVAAYFPDPWPKARHHKRRLIQPSLVGQIARVLEPGGRILLATDWESYADEMLKVMDAEPALVNEAGRGRFAPRSPIRPVTRFESRGQALGHAVWDLAFVKSATRSL